MVCIERIAQMMMLHYPVYLLGKETIEIIMHA